MRLSLLILCLVITGCRSEPPIDYEFSFRESQFDEEFFRLVGTQGVKVWEYLHREPNGLRILLPEEADANMVGIATRGQIAGDFEVTINYEIIDFHQPTNGFGVGPGIYLKTESTDQAVAVLSRLKREKEGDVYNAYHSRKRDDGTTQHRPEFTTTDTLAGRLRLTRKGEVLSYYVSDAKSENFELIHSVPLNRNDVSIVRFGVDRGGANVPVEVLFKELSIRTKTPVSVGPTQQAE